MLQPGQRTADNNIYLNEDRFEEPKEVFKLIGERIAAFNPLNRAMDVIDVGCATGEQLFYLTRRLTVEHRLVGVDVSGEMIERAREAVPWAEFKTASILEDAIALNGTFDIVICSGVLSIFDDLTLPFKNLLRLLKKDGLLLVFTLINDTNIDLVCRYREGGGRTDWEKGWNIFSKATIETVLRELSDQVTINFIDFEMPFDLEKKSDPMRTYTVHLDGKRTLINGAGLICTQKLIEIRR